MEYIIILIAAFLIYSFFKPSTPSSKTVKNKRRKVITSRAKKQKPVTVDIQTEPAKLCLDPEKLQNLNTKIEVQGSDNNIYDVNLQTLSCTCQDFDKRRWAFPPGDIRRICKHQAKALVQSKQITKLTTDKRIHATIMGSTKKGFPVYSDGLQVIIKGTIKGPGLFYLFIEPDNPWLNIVIFSAKSFDRHGYNIKEKRWAYKANPFPDGAKKKYNKAIEIAYEEARRL